MRCVYNDLLNEHTDGDDTIDWVVSSNEKMVKGEEKYRMS